MQFLGLTLLHVLLGVALTAKLNMNLALLGLEEGADPDAAHKALMALLSEGEPLDPTVSSLVNMAESIAKQDPSSQEESVNTIRTLVSGLLDSIESQFNISQQSLQNQAAYATCSAKKTENLGNITASPSNYTNTTDAHLTCLSELEDLNVTFVSCKTQEDLLKVAETAACDHFAAEDKSPNFEEWFCNQDDFSESKTYEEYLERSVNWLDVFRLARTNCGTATTSWEDQRDECAQQTGQMDIKKAECRGLEPGVVPPDCQPYQAKKQACEDYDFCWGQAGTAGATAENAATQMAASLKVEYRSLKRMVCLLDVILSTGDQTGELEACIAKTHDTSHLDITSPSAPEKEACDHGQPPAGCAA